MNKAYFNRVDLLLGILPDVMQDSRLALKGGTAINMFALDMPRLSVDIDLTYVPVEDRLTSLQAIDDIFHIIKTKLQSRGLRVQAKLTAEGHAKQLIVEDAGNLVKVEINHVLRGCLHNCVMKELSKKAQNTFNKFVSVQCLDEPDLFAGKICATLDRQHPRDLYDMLFFLENLSYTRKLHEAFLIYLISNNRPISELIKPNELDLSNLYNTAFLGMTEQEIPLNRLKETFNKVVDLTYTSMTDQDKEFLISFKSGKPKWELISFNEAANLPAIKWKLHNINMMDKAKQKDAVNKLAAKLAYGGTPKMHNLNLSVNSLVSLATTLSFNVNRQLK